MITIFSGFVIGLFGSLHCVGMCGPLVLSLPLTNREKISIASQSLVYNLGRTLTYGIMGLFMGLMGWGLEIGGLQRLFSIGLGIFLLYLSITNIFPLLKITSIVPHISWIGNMMNKIKQSLIINSNSNAIKIGMLNGILPCGLVYVALASSITMSSPILSSLYMVAFGIGTIPLMFLVMVGGNLYKSFTRQLRKLLPFGMAILGIYLIYRGWTLEVPLDPKDILNGVVHLKCH